jgi:hypothetical protein
MHQLLLRCGGKNGTDDVAVAGTTANIALNQMSYGIFIEIFVPIDQLNRAHDKSWSTEAALKAMMLDKCTLHGMQIAVRAFKPFNRSD